MTSQPSGHTAISAGWQGADGEIRVAGRSLARAVEIAGGTPCYLYDAGRIAARVDGLKRRLPANVELHYAVKANPMPAVVALLARLTDGFDVASAGELKTALETGMPAARISFAGPGKSLAELRQGLAAGILFNVESFREARLLATLGDETGCTPRVAIRANLPFELKASGMKMTGGPKPFGIDAAQVPDMLSFVGAAGFAFEGFHLFAGSQNLKAEAIVEAQQESLRVALEWTDKAPAPPRIFNIGGGFGIPYAAADRPLALDPVLDNLAELGRTLAARLPDASLALELGRYLVGEAGLYVAQILERKLSGGYPFLVTDGGMHQHLAASGNFGQVIRRNYPVAISPAPGRALADSVETVTVTGPLCTPLDVLANRADLPQAEAGDFVVVFQSGAYGKSASPREFLGHPEVKESLLWPQGDD